MKSILYFILFLSVVSCGNSKTSFTVENKSEKPYDSIIINCAGSLKFTNVKDKEKVSGVLEHMPVKGAKHDMGFAISLYKSGLIKRDYFGYYTGGGSQYTILILKDTILYKQKTINE